MPASYVLLEHISVTTAVASVTFDNLPTTGYSDLRIIASARSTSNEANDWVAGYLNFNGVSTNLTSTSFVGRLAGTDSFDSGSIAYCFWSSGSNTTANTYGISEIIIPNYRSTTQYKTYDATWAEENNSSTAAITGMSGGAWASNSAITSITFTPAAGNLAIGSSFSLYGIANLDTTPASAPSAEGGNIVATDGSYWYHAFLTSGVFTPLKNLTCDILQIAGGGSGGTNGGGGGAGGVLAFASQSLTATKYPVLIGAGAIGLWQNGYGGVQGNNSKFGSLTASVGGGYGGSVNGIGGNGGSGGGGGRGTGTGGSPTSGQGFAGGNSTNGGGGGGGAGAAAPNNSSVNGGTGGAGTNTYTGWGTFSAMVSATGLGVSGYFAGGGGGGAYSGAGASAGGSGGSGGGGAGTLDANVPGNGTANTGSGGGGSFSASSGGQGGSGLVIVRYAI